MALPWILFALIAGVFLFAYNMCAKIGGGNLPPVVFATVMYTAGFIAVIAFYLFKVKEQHISYITSQPSYALIFAALGGICVIIVDTALAAMFNQKAPVGLGITAVFILALSLTTLAGLIFFKEQVSLINILGIALALISIPMLFYGQK